MTALLVRADQHRQDVSAAAAMVTGKYDEQLDAKQMPKSCMQSRRITTMQQPLSPDEIILYLWSWEESNPRSSAIL